MARKRIRGGTLHFGLQYIDQTDLINAQFQEDISIYQNIANITNAQKYNYNNTNGVKAPNTAYYDLKESIEASSNNLGMNFIIIKFIRLTTNKQQIIIRRSIARFIERYYFI